MILAIVFILIALIFFCFGYCIRVTSYAAITFEEMCQVYSNITLICESSNVYAINDYGDKIVLKKPLEELIAKASEYGLNPLFKKGNIVFLEKE